jgi:hypothetical protein
VKLKPKPNAAGLTDLTVRIRSVLDRMEGQFLTAGESLAASYERFGALGNGIDGLKALVDGGALAQLSRKSLAFKSQLQEPLEQLERTVEPLGALWIVAQDLTSDAEAMYRQVQTMNIVALNARVNVAALPEDVSGLAAFTEDSRRLVEEASVVLKKVMSDLRLIHKHSTKARDIADDLSRTVLREAAFSARELLERVSKFETKLMDLRSSGSELTVRIQAIAGMIGSTVIALQSGDSTRQRLEHVNEIVASVKAAGQGSAFGHALCGLVQRHLAAADDVHTPSLKTALATLDAVRRDTDLLMAEVQRRFAQDLQGTEQIRTNLRRIRSLIRACELSQDQLRETAGLISVSYQSVFDLVNRLDAVDEDMRLIGFNAVISCAGLGDRALALKEVAKQLRELAESITKPHTALKDRLGQLKEIADQALAGMTASSEKLEGVLGILTTDLGGDVDQIGAALSALFDVIVESQTHLAADVANGLTALTAHSAAFKHLSDAICSAPKPDAPLEFDAPMRAVADRLRDILTIESEREVHDDWLADISPDIPSAPVTDDPEDVPLAAVG